MKQWVRSKHELDEQKKIFLFFFLFALFIHFISEGEMLTHIWVKSKFLVISHNIL